MLESFSLCNITYRDVTEPAKIHFCRIRILYFKSVGFRYRCGFVPQSQLVQFCIASLVYRMKL